MQYHGIFKDIKENCINIIESEIYEDYFATFYHKFCDKTNYDLAYYIDQAFSFNNKEIKILELACGTGRITIPLVKKQFNVTAIDLSSSMLDVLRNQANKLPRKLKRNLTLKQINILDIDFNEEFDLVILPATTICLLNKDEINILFDNVYYALKKNGKFIFDFINEAEERDDFVNGNREVIEIDKDELCMYQEFKDYKNRVSIVDFYVEKQNKKYMTSTIKNMINKNIIIEAVKKSKFNNNNLCSEFLNSFQSNELIINILEKVGD